MANQVIKRIKVNDTTYDIQPAIIDAETIPSTIARIASPAFSGTPTAPTPSSGDNSTNIATTAFVQTAINGIGAVANALRYKGVVSLEDPFPSTYDVGDVYKVAVAGEYLGQYCEVGDMFICTNGSENASQNIANDWNIIQVNETGNLSGPNGSTNNNLVAFDGTAGNVVKDSGVGVETSLTSNSDATIPTSKAVATYITNQGFAIANNLNLGAAAQKGIISNISENNNSTDLPTAAAVYNFVIGQNYLTSNDLSLGDAAGKNVDTTLTGKSNSTNLPTSKAVLDYGFMTQSDVSSYLTDNNYLTTNNVTIGAAASKGVDTSSSTISSSSTDNNVPTSKAVYNYITNYDFSSFNTDENVKQSITSSSYYFPLLLANTGYNSSTASISTEDAAETKKASGLRYSPSNNNLVVGKINNYQLKDACSYDVTTSYSNISSSATSSIPTSAAVYNYIDNLGLTNVVTDVKAPYSNTTAVTKVSNGVATLNVASTSYYGLTKLTNSVDSSTTSLAVTPYAVYNYIDGLGLTNVATAPLIITTSNSSTSDALTYGTNTTLTTGQLVFIKLNRAMSGTSGATIQLGTSTTYKKNIYLNNTTQLTAAYAAGTVLGCVYDGSKLIMINPQIAV